MVNKKAISPVVATILLLVVAVVAVVGFQTWYQTYQSGVTADVEKKSDTGVTISVERLENNTVYLKNSESTDISASALKINGNQCNGSFIITPGVKGYGFNTTNCPLKKGDTVDVVIITDDGIFQETENVK
jgi:flagellin-like protein